MRRRFLQLTLGALLLAPLGFASATEGAPILSAIAERGTLRVGMSAGQPPYNVKNRDGNIIGMEVDLAGLLARALEVELDIVEMPFGELLDALEKGKVDLVMSGMTSTMKRNMRAAFVGPYHVTGKSILARSENAAQLQSEQLNSADLTFVALKGSTSETFVKRVAPDAELVATDTYDKAIDLLLSNKADAFVADASIIMLSMLRWPEAGLVAANKPLTVEPIGIAVPPGDPLLVNLVENYLEAMKAAGVVEGLNEKWFKNGGWLVQLP